MLPLISKPIWRDRIGEQPERKRLRAKLTQARLFVQGASAASLSHGGQILHEGVRPVDRAAQRVQAAIRGTSENAMREGEIFKKKKRNLLNLQLTVSVFPLLTDAFQTFLKWRL